MRSAEATCANMASTHNPENDLRHPYATHTQETYPYILFVCTPNTQAHPYIHYAFTLHTKANTYTIYTNKHTYIYSHACTLHTQDNTPLYTYIHVHFTYKHTLIFIHTCTLHTQANTSDVGCPSVYMLILLVDE